MKGVRLVLDSIRLCRVPEEAGGAPRIAVVLAASRLCVVFMTVYSVVIGGLLAALQGSFDPLVFVALLVAFSLSHVADNLLNDYSDYRKGIDTPGYFRALYGPHPLIDGIVTPRQALGFVATVLALDAVLAVYLTLKAGIVIAALALLGALAMTSYAGVPFDAKRLGLGEAIVALVWGPVMAGGTLIAMGGRHSVEALLVYMPYAVTVSLVLVGKHLDKLPMDSAKMVGTLPVRLGEHASRRLAALIATLAPIAAAVGVYLYTGSLLALATAAAGVIVSTLAARVLLAGRPATPPSGWRVWPLWYAAWGYIAMDATARTTIAALIVALLEAKGYTLPAILLAIATLAFEIRYARNIHPTSKAIASQSTGQGQVQEGAGGRQG